VFNLFSCSLFLLVQKFLRLLDYLKKLVPQADSPEMDIKVVSTSNRQEDVLVSKYIKSADRVKRFIVQLRKGTRDKYEWLELVLDATFDTQQAFRIDVNWLVASCSKVEAQIQLLLRRCMQYGLRIVQLPNYANSSNLYLHPVRLTFTNSIANIFFLIDSRLNSFSICSNTDSLLHRVC